MGNKKIVLSKEEIETLYHNEICRRERENPSKKVLGVFKKKIVLTAEEKRNLIAEEVYRREQILKANEELAREHRKTKSVLSYILPVLLIVLLVVGLHSYSIKKTQESVVTMDVDIEDDVPVYQTPTPTVRPSPRHTVAPWWNDEPTSTKREDYPDFEPKLTMATDSPDEVISRYNSLNPPIKISKDMIDYNNSGYSPVTTAYFGDYRMEFGVTDGWPYYYMYCNMQYSDENTESFFVEAKRFLRAVYKNMSDTQAAEIISRFRSGEEGITDVVSGDYIRFIERSNSSSDYTYRVSVSEKWW